MTPYKKGGNTKTSLNTIRIPTESPGPYKFFSPNKVPGLKTRLGCVHKVTFEFQKEKTKAEKEELPVTNGRIAD